MQFQKEDDLDAEELAAQLKERYSRSDYGVFRGDKETVPQNVLIPGVRDPKLAMVKCKAGKERDIILNITKKYFSLESGSNSIKIYSVFYRNGIPGYIYVEGDNLENIKESVQGIMNVYLNSIKVVPVNEMTQCLTIKSKEKELLVGSWIRVKRGKYSGDIGQILNIDSAENVTIKLMPRIDAFGGPKRKKAEQRPPQKLFNYRDFESNRECEARDGGYYYQNEFYTREGYLEKSMKVISLQTENVNPTLEEVTAFSGGAVEGGTDDVALIGAVAAATVEDFQVGENVEVIVGELKNVKGTVQSVQNGVVTILPDASFGFNEPIPFPATELRKKFDVGDHVKVASGIYKGVTGLVINIENNVTSILSDADLKPVSFPLLKFKISVFSKDLKAATEITTGEVTGGQYSIDDFVQIS
jgi:transcription elongation factor SPT5